MNIMSILRDTLYTIIYSNQYLNRYILVKIDSYHLKTLFSLCKVDNKVTLENATQEDSRFREVADIDSLLNTEFENGKLASLRILSE